MWANAQRDGRPAEYNTNLPPILHRFRDIAVDRSEIAIFYYPSCVYFPRRRGSPATISVKFSVAKRMAKVPNAAEILPKI